LKSSRKKNKRGITAIVLGGIFAIAIAYLLLNSSASIFDTIAKEQVAIQIGFVVGTITFVVWLVNHLRKKEMLHKEEREFLTSLTGFYAISSILLFP